MCGSNRLSQASLQDHRLDQLGLDLDFSLEQRLEVAVGEQGFEKKCYRTSPDRTRPR